MANNKNSSINVFGKVSNLFQCIFSADRNSSSVDVDNDIRFIVKDISGKIGDLSLSPDNTINLRNKLDDLETSGKTAEQKGILEEIKKIVLTSGSSIITKGIVATIDAAISKLR